MNYIIVLLFFIMWFAAAISMIPTIGPYANNLEPWKQMIVSMIIIIGSPFMLITQAIELILDCFLEEGWHDDD